MEDIKKVEYEIYNNGFVKVLGVKEVKYTDGKNNNIEYEHEDYDDTNIYDDWSNSRYVWMSFSEQKELGLKQDYYMKYRRYHLIIKTNSSEYNTTDYGTVKLDYVKDYEIKKTGLYACEIRIITFSDILKNIIKIDGCEIDSNCGIKYYAYGMNNQELERIENEASLMAANYSGIMATNYAIDDALSKAEYLRNYNEYKSYFTNQLILNRSLNSSVEDKTFKQKIKEYESI